MKFTKLQFYKKKFKKNLLLPPVNCPPNEQKHCTMHRTLRASNFQSQQSGSSRQNKNRSRHHLYCQLGLVKKAWYFYLHIARNSSWQLLGWKGLTPTSSKVCLQWHVMLKKKMKNTVWIVKEEKTNIEVASHLPWCLLLTRVRIF